MSFTNSLQTSGSFKQLKLVKLLIGALVAGMLVTVPASIAHATEFTVTYDANANQPQAGAVSGTIAAPAVTSSGTTTLPTSSNVGVTRQGFTFAGWNTAANGTGTAYAGGATYTASANITLYAQWSIPTAARLIGATGTLVSVTNPNSVPNGTYCSNSDIRGITSDGTYVYFRSSSNIQYICQVTMTGVVVRAAYVASLTFTVDSRALAYSAGCIIIRTDTVANANTSTFNCIDTSDWSMTTINLPAGKPILGGGGWLFGNLINFPDGRIGAVSAPNQVLPTGTGAGQCPSGMYCKVLRLYTLAGTGKTVVPTFSEDIVLADTQSGWPDDDHGISTDGTYLYEIHFSAGYKVWALQSAKPSYLVFNGEGTGACGAATGVSGTRCPINVPNTGLATTNATYLGRNHVTGQYIMGDYGNLTAAVHRFYLSAAATPPVGPGNPAPTFTSVSPNTGLSTGGNTVTITGTGFLSATGVTIDGVAATVLSVTSTTITIKTPVTSTGAKNIVVTSPTGNATGTGVFTVSDPNITSIGVSGDTLTVNTATTTNLQSVIGHPLVITGYDPAHILRVVVSTSLGTLSETATAGLSLPTGYQTPSVTSTGSAAIALTGTMADLNAALATVRLTSSGTAGTANITVDVSDAGTGSIAFNPDNGHYYQYISTAVTWDGAYQAITGTALANDLTIAPTTRSINSCAYTFNGMCGYFATVTTAKENAYITSKVGTASAWLGGADRVQAGKWVWSDPIAPEYNKYFSDMYSGYAGRPDQMKNTSPYDKGTGTSPTGQCVGYTLADSTTYCYANWNASEPNNFNGNETALQLLSGGTGLWNDLNEFSSSTTMGYIVEYGGNSEPLLYPAAHRTLTATIVAPATTFAFTGPGGGPQNAPSAPFTVKPNGFYTGTVTITGKTTGNAPAAYGPIDLTWANSSTAQSFTVTEANLAIDTLTVTNAPTTGSALTNPAALNYSTIPATSFALTGPSTLVAGQTSGSFTINPNGPYGETFTVVVSGGGLSQTTTYPFTLALDSQSFTITPTSSGTVTISVTGPGLTPSPSVLTYVVIGSGYTLTGPSTGSINVESTNFSVVPNGTYTGTVTATIAGGGLSQTKTLTFASSATPETFTVTPTHLGSVRITLVASPALGSDTSTTYVVTTAPTLYVNPRGGNIGHGVPAVYLFDLLSDPNDPTSVVDPTTLTGYTAPVCSSAYTITSAIGQIYTISCTGGAATGYIFDTTATDNLDVVTAVVFTYPTPINGQVGTALSGNVPTLVTGAVNSWLISPALPAPLDFNQYTGEITGTPSATMSPTTFTISGYADGVLGIFTVTIGFAAAPVAYSPPAQTVTTTTAPPITSGAPLTFPIVAPGATGFTVSGGTLPAGLTLNPTSGVISGTPTSSGPYSFTVTVTNAYGQTSTVTFSGNIAAGAPASSTTGTGNGTSGTGTGSGTGANGLGSGLGSLAPVTPPASIITALLQNVATTTNGGSANLGGNVSVLVNGATTTANLQPNTTNTGYVLTAPGWTLNLLPLDSSGNPVPLNGNSQIVLATNRLVGVAGDGFKPNSTVNVYIFSTPTLLGTVTTDAQGKFKANFPVASDINTGNHVIQVNGYSPKDEVRSASVGLLVEATSSTSTINLTKVGSAGVVPFSAAKYKIGSAQTTVLSKYRFTKNPTLLVIGYASKTTGEDDIRISLDRALEVKAALAKRYPGATITALGGGVTTNPLCSKYLNQCAVVKVRK